MRMRESRLLGWIIVIGLLILFIIFGFSGVDIVKTMIGINNWFYNRLGAGGIYLATIGISVIGNFTVIMPVPYILAILTVLLVLPVNPYILAIASALGASIGELSAWLLGRGAAEVIKKESYEKRIKGLEALIERGLGFWLVLFFAATPLPDDVLLIALGMKKFPLKISLIASVIGKTMQVLSLFVVVVIAKNTVIGQGMLYLFGLDITNGGVRSTGDTYTSTITIAVTIILTLVLITVDWERVWKRLKKQRTLGDT